MYILLWIPDAYYYCSVFRLECVYYAYTTRTRGGSRMYTESGRPRPPPLPMTTRARCIRRRGSSNGSSGSGSDSRNGISSRVVERTRHGRARRRRTLDNNIIPARSVVSIVSCARVKNVRFWFFFFLLLFLYPFFYFFRIAVRLRVLHEIITIIV